MDVIGNIRKVIAFVFRAGNFTVTIKADDTVPPTKDITLNVVDGDASQTIVSDSSANTLTNKTINSDSKISSSKYKGYYFSDITNYIHLITS